jgi:hypothetical protein
MRVNFESLISILLGTDWGFLAFWVLLLGAAYAACFRESLAPLFKSVPSRRPRRVE